jgi:two-component system response regulator GlrR
MLADRRSQRSPVLLVEDDFESAQALGAALGSAGYPVRWARTGEEGLELLLLERRRSVVLLDLMLPDMTGVQFGRRLPNSHTRPPLILISGSSPQVLSEAAALLQPMVALRKPVDLADLLAWVDAAWRETNAG